MAADTRCPTCPCEHPFRRFAEEGGREVSLARMIARLRPGKHFLGLWVYRQHHHRKQPPKWTVTMWDTQNEYCETALHVTPRAALVEALCILKRGKRDR